MRYTRLHKVCAGLCAVVTVLSAAGCSSSDSSSKGSDSSVNEVLSSTAEVDNVTYDTSVKASDLETGYDEQFSSKISFEEGAVTAGEGVTIDGTTATITAAGTYLVSGSCGNGRIVVDAGKKTEVRLVLNGVDLTCADNAPVYAASGSKLIITLADGTDNKLTDGSEYVLSDSESNVDAALFSKADLTINGSGSLTVKANCKHGIVSKDALVIAGGKITVDSVSTAVTGKDSVKILDGELDITAGTNGIKSSNSEDASLGFVSISGGNIKIVSGGDGIQAETSLMIEGGEFDITAGGGSANSTSSGKEDMWGGMGGNRGGNNFGGGEMTPPDGDMSLPDDFSMPDGQMPQMPDDFSFPDGDFPGGMQDGDMRGGRGGMRGGMREDMQGGFENTAFTVSDDTAAFELTAAASSDDSSTSSKALKAGGSVVISGGTFTIDSSDDSVHSNGSVSISGGKLTALSGDDGIHADEDVLISGSAEIDIQKSYEGIEGKTITISGGDTKVTASDDGLNASAGSSDSAGGFGGGFGGVSEGVYLKITGGTLTVNASGDGLDSNGDFYMEGGTVYVSGPTNGGNGALDYGERCTATVTGGTLIACGAVGMEEGFDASGSTQYSFLYNLASTVSGGTELTVTDSSGNVLLTFTPEKSFQSVVFTSPELKDGETYTVTAGSLSETVTLNGISTSNSTGMSMGGGFGGGQRGGWR